MFEVARTELGSPAQTAGIRAGDRIVSINTEPLIDYIDYVYFCAEKKLDIVLDSGMIQRSVRVRKREDEDLGLVFTTELLGKKRVCANKCEFCFVDQLPRGMRKALYLKDEDWRYSFVMGNYVTLASTDEDELRRIIRRRVSPLYLSVHTVDEALRRRMLGNANANPIRPLLKKLARSRIRFHAQAVICPGRNDGEKLGETIRFLKKLHPAAISLAVVPVGLTAHRQGLPYIEAVDIGLARRTVAEVEKWQKECLNRMGTRFVFAADEFYIKAGLAMPPYAEYEAFDQLENGVGLVRKFLDEADEAMQRPGKAPGRMSAATGVDAAPYIQAAAEQAGERGGAQISVYAVENRTFGASVTVTGLLGGRDILEALRGKDLGEMLLISAAALRDDDVFIDDVTRTELAQALGVDVVPVDGGAHFARMAGFGEG